MITMVAEINPGHQVINKKQKGVTHRGIFTDFQMYLFFCSQIEKRQHVLNFLEKKSVPIDRPVVPSP